LRSNYVECDHCTAVQSVMTWHADILQISGCISNYWTHRIFRNWSQLFRVCALFIHSPL